EEAWEMIKEELTIRRMLAMRVNSLAFQSVTPKDVRQAYENYEKEHPRTDAWRYQVISVRGENADECEELANYAFQLLQEESCPIDELEHALTQSPYATGNLAVNISNDYHNDEKDISESHKQVLCALAPATFSPPISQQSRANQSTVFRIFYLKEIILGGAPPYEEMENQLKERLIEETIHQESEKYIAKLRKHFDVENMNQYHMIPDDFLPFALK
ncbi:MAG: peptidyl-prolyl cis-trans isomerase, partial [Waddliaceae bacterium]